MTQNNGIGETGNLRRSAIDERTTRREIKPRSRKLAPTRLNTTSRVLLEITTPPGDALESSSPITIQIIAIDDHVTHVNADPKYDLFVFVLIEIVTCALDY